MKFKYSLPPLYQKYFPASLWNGTLSETKATCDSCIQAPDKYKSDLKCCTFWPFIPNYIVGQLLLNSDIKYQEVQETIRRHISEHKFNFPMGLMAPPSYQVKFKKLKADIFGNDDEFLCPYYSKKTNNCGAWLYRGSVCTSFFCESSYKKKGQAFWHRFENYMSYLEMGLSQEVLAYKDFSPRDVNDQMEYLSLEKKVELPEATYKKIWKHYYRNEIEFYKEAARFVDQLPKNQIQDVLGETGKEIKKQMINAYQLLL